MMFVSFVALALLGCSFGMPMNTTDLPQNSTAVEIDCTLYRPHSEDPHMYEVFSQGEWQNQTCIQALIWDQDLCRCENPPSDDLDCGKQAVPGSPTKYQVIVWGVVLPELVDCPRDQIWNETGCRCDWDPEGPGAVVESPDFVHPTLARSCDIMFNATFDTEIREHQSNYYIGQNPWGSIKIEDTEGAIGGGAARVDNGQMVIWALAGNTFSDAFQIQLRFKVENPVDDYVTLFSNECGSDDATIIVKYNAMTNMYQVFFRDFNSSVTSDCVPQSPPQGFVSISLEYQGGYLSFVVDGQLACGPAPFNGQPPVSTCPLTLGGNPVEQTMNLEGYMDEVVIRRNCVVKAQVGEQ